MYSSKPTSYALKGRAITSVDPDRAFIGWRRLLIIFFGLIALFLVILVSGYSILARTTEELKAEFCSAAKASEPCTLIRSELLPNHPKSTEDDEY